VVLDQQAQSFPTHQQMHMRVLRQVWQVDGIGGGACAS